jgi:hypothetical protein
MMRRWIAFWDAREPATVLAAVRIAVGVVLLADFTQVAALDLSAFL